MSGFIHRNGKIIVSLGLATIFVVDLYLPELKAHAVWAGLLVNMVWVWS